MTGNDIKFRCSSLVHIMTNPREKAKKESGELSEGCKTHLVDVFVSAMYKRKEEIEGKFLDKGNEREEDSITLLSRLKKIFFKKNEGQIINNFISGTPDLYLGKDVRSADETFDTKTSWSAHTFFRAQKAELNKMYYWQGMGYMALTGASKHTVAYCLVNGTESAILSEKRRLSWKMGLIDPHSNSVYKEKCKQIEINHIFDIKSFINECPHFELDNDFDKWTFDIPMEERLFTISFNRENSEIEKLYRRVNECRDWMENNLFKPDTSISISQGEEK